MRLSRDLVNLGYMCAWQHSRSASGVRRVCILVGEDGPLLVATVWLLPHQAMQLVRDHPSAAHGTCVHAWLHACTCMCAYARACICVQLVRDHPSAAQRHLDGYAYVHACAHACMHAHIPIKLPPPGPSSSMALAPSTKRSSSSTHRRKL